MEEKASEKVHSPSVHPYKHLFSISHVELPMHNWILLSKHLLVPGRHSYFEKKTIKVEKPGLVELK